MTFQLQLSPDPIQHSSCTGDKLQDGWDRFAISEGQAFVRWVPGIAVYNLNSGLVRHQRQPLLEVHVDDAVFRIGPTDALNLAQALIEASQACEKDTTERIKAPGGDQ